MTPTLESVHSVLRLVKGLTVASIRANRNSTKSSEKSDLEEERLENTPFSHKDVPYDTSTAHHDERIAQEKAADRRDGLAGMFQKLGNRPE
jgi:hypothetical protein